MDSYFPHQENKATTSSSSPQWKHHVFTSFHGPDVRNGFLSHLLSEFKSKGINAFVDNHMETSKTIYHELIEAIRESRIAIVVLSKNYASSTWCLDELVEIMECRQELGQTVMSVFYEVDPTDIRHQTGYFGEVFKTTCEGKAKEDDPWQRRINSDDLQRWKDALTKVAQIKGYHSTNWKNDRKMIEDIAIDVWSKLNNITVAPPSDFDFLVGVESHMTKMGPLLQLDSDEVRTIGILGPCGIGKTTIARCLFDRHSRDFDFSVFMDIIKTKSATPDCSDGNSVKLDLHKQLMSQLTNEVGIEIQHLGIVTDRFKDKKVLVVLDDVNRSVQMEAMAKETWFGPGSRIIVTTQDQKILKEGGIKYIYKVDLPSHVEALKMFSMYAFFQESPNDGFRELASEFISLVGKLPLGLSVMGSYLRGFSKKYWIEGLKCFTTRSYPIREIESILKFSYDAYDYDKRLFLHIACFFNDERVDIVEGCLASCFSDVTQGLRVLVEKSLISMDSERIKMQELLVQLGRKIVREQSVSEPGKRQFLNDAIDIDEVLNDDEPDSSNVLGIYLRENINFVLCTSERAFERLPSLQFLSIHSNAINPQSLSGKLRFLRCWEFPMPCFPSSFNPKFLVKLEMQNSKLVKLWEKTQQLSILKWMDLSDSESLKELPDLSSATNLYYLNLIGCSSLVEIPSSIGKAINLKYLLLKYCKSLVKLPSSIENAINLKYLYLSHCLSIVELPQLPYSVVELEADNCESLERLDCSFLNPGIRLNFLNCFKLNQEAKDLIIQTRTNHYAVLPGGKVPQCFTYRKSGGSLTVKLNQNHLGTSTRFKACIVYAAEVSSWRKEDISCSITSKENVLTSIKAIGQVFQGNMYTFEVDAEEVTSTELVFEFKFQSYFDVELEIKECGILQILEIPSVSRMKRKREEDIEAE